MLANKNLEQMCAATETVRLKGGAWDGNKPIFIYSTSSHVKYLIPNGDCGIIRGLETPIYITKVHGNSLFCLDREGKMRVLEVDATEAAFKLALEAKDYPEVMRMVKNSRLCGQAIITYLTEKGYPEVALHFVQDNRSKFDLALACGNIQVAMNVAYDLGDDAWRQLGIEALRQGNHEVVEMSYMKTKEYDRLSFLYMITGNTTKLRKMLKIADLRGDVMSQFQNAMFLGDAEKRADSRKYRSTYISIHGGGIAWFDRRQRENRTSAGGAKLAVPNMGANKKTLLQPPTAIFRGENWPLLSVGKSALSDMQTATSSNSAPGPTSNNLSSMAMDGDGAEEDALGNWEDDDDDLFDDDEDKEKQVEATGTEGAGWGEDEDLDLSDDDDTGPVAPQRSKEAGDDAFSTVPQAGNPPTLAWCESSHAADHFAAGSAETGLQLLRNQIAATDVSSLKANARALFLGSSVYVPGLPLASSARSFLTRDGGKSSEGGKPMPSLALKLAPLLDLLKNAYRAFNSGNFEECEKALRQIITSIPLVAAANRSEVTDIKELVDIAREYLTAVRVKTAIGSASDTQRSFGTERLLHPLQAAIRSPLPGTQAGYGSSLQG